MAEVQTMVTELVESFVQGMRMLTQSCILTEWQIYHDMVYYAVHKSQED
jgi:hypothetical protein